MSLSYMHWKSFHPFCSIIKQHQYILRTSNNHLDRSMSVVEEFNEMVLLASLLHWTGDRLNPVGDLSSCPSKNKRFLGHSRFSIFHNALQKHFQEMMSVPHGQDLWYHHLQYQPSICSLFIGVPDMVKHTLNDYGLLWHNSGLLWQAYMLPYC